MILGVTIYNLEPATSAIDGSLSDQDLQEGTYEQVSVCNSTEYQGVDTLNQGLTPSQTSSTVTTATYNPYTASNIISRYDLPSLANPPNILQQSQQQQSGAFHIPAFSHEYEHTTHRNINNQKGTLVSMQVHASNDDDPKQTQLGVDDQHLQSRTLVNDYQKRNGIPKFRIWEDQC